MLEFYVTAEKAVRHLQILREILQEHQDENEKLREQVEDLKNQLKALHKKGSGVCQE